MHEVTADGLGSAVPAMEATAVLQFAAERPRGRKVSEFGAADCWDWPPAPGVSDAFMGDAILAMMGYRCCISQGMKGELPRKRRVDFRSLMRWNTNLDDAIGRGTGMRWRTKSSSLSWIEGCNTMEIIHGAGRARGCWGRLFVKSWISKVLSRPFRSNKSAKRGETGNIDSFFPIPLPAIAVLVGIGRMSRLYGPRVL